MASASGNSPHKGLRTSKDVYDRIKWDLSTDTDLNSFFIGYEDRFEGMKELQFQEYIPGGDIPWHRIYYFRKNDEILWDRRRRIDKIFDSGGGKPANQNSKKKSKRRIRKQYDESSDEEEFQGEIVEEDPVSEQSENLQWPDGFKILPNQCYKFDEVAQKWKSSKVPKNADIAMGRDDFSLKIVSFNVLFGLFGLDVGTQEDDRIPALLSCVCHEDADIICLQEVTYKFLMAILEKRWVRNRYYITQNDDLNCHLLKPCGQIVLCKFPLTQTAVYNFGPDKRLLAVEIHLNSTISIRLVNLHLTSAKREDDPAKVEMGAKRRLQQLVTALNAADDSCPNLVVGDFNFGDNTPEYLELKKLLKMHQYRDAWVETNPNNPGFTYDPGTNALAAYTVTKHFEPRRLDRVLIRTGDHFQVTFDAMKLLGLEPVADGHKPLFMSDHYGLSLLLNLKKLVTADGSIKPKEMTESANRNCSNQQDMDISSNKHYMDLYPDQQDMDLSTANPAEYVSSLRPVHTSALCLVPSKLGPLYPLVQHIRAQFDPHCHRWPPHINLLYPFIPDNDNNFQTALNYMTHYMKFVLTEWEYFGSSLNLTFASFGIFERNNSSTVFLYPEFHIDKFFDESKERKVLLFLNNSQTKVTDQAFRVLDQNEHVFIEHPLNLLYETLMKVFPLCGNTNRSSLMPHLSVATFKNTNEARLAAKTWQKSWKPITCPFTSFALMSRCGDDPFTVKHQFAWCNKNEEQETAFSKETVEQLRELGRRGFIEILAKADIPVDARWFGSVAVNLDTKSSDADLCICSTKSVEEVIQVLSASQQVLPVHPDDNKFSKGFPFPTYHLWHCVNYSEESTFKLLRYEELISKCCQLEVAFAQVPESWFDSKLASLNLHRTDEELSSLNWTSIKSLSGIRDGEFLKNYLIDPNSNTAMIKQFMAVIKKWAGLRCVDSHCMGYIPKIAWLAMCIEIYQMYKSDLSQLEENEIIKQLVFRFFHHFSSKIKWNPLEGQAVAVTDNAKEISQRFYKTPNTISKGTQHMCVMGFTYPCSNYCRNVTSSTMAVIREEMKSALSDYQKNENVDDILHPLDIGFFKLYNFYLAISLKLVNVPDDETGSFSIWPPNFPPNMLDINFHHWQLRIAHKWFLSQIVNIVFELEKCLKQPKPHQIVAHPYMELFSFQNANLTTFIGYNISTLEDVKIGRVEKIMEQFKSEFEKWKINPSVNCDNVRLDFQIMEKSNDDIQNLHRLEYFTSRKVLT